MFKDVIAHIRNTFNEPNGFIPLHAPTLAGNEKKYLEECIDSTFVSSVGKFVDRFEEDMARYTGAQHAIVTMNGTAALHMAMMLAGVERDTLVITQPLTFIATANAISYIGAQPVFLDVDKDTMGLSASAVKAFLENECDGNIHKATGKRVSAIVPMHTFGHPVNMNGLDTLSQKHAIPIVEDAAESLGSYYNQKHTGTLGLLGTLSFNGNKTITTGGGGMILTNNEELAIKAKHLTTQAKVPHRWKYEHDHTGYNYRMPNVNAAIGVAQLEQLPDFLIKKRALATNYIEFFKNQEIQFIQEPSNSKSNYWLNAIMLQDEEQREAFLKETNDAGVMTRPIWALMNHLEMYKNAITGDLTNSEWLEKRVVNIPSSVL